MRTVIRASQILELSKPTAEPVSDSCSWKGAAREGSMWDIPPSFSIACLPPGYADWSCFNNLDFTYGRLQKCSSQEICSSPSFSCWWLISDDFQPFSLLLCVLLAIYSYHVPFSLGLSCGCDWSGLQVRAPKNSTIQSCMNCCSSTFTLARLADVVVELAHKQLSTSSWTVFSFWLIEWPPCTISIFCWLSYWFFKKLFWCTDFMACFGNPPVQLWLPWFSACLA